MLIDRLQGPGGRPRLRTRVLALLVVVGMIVLTAPIVVLPLAHLVAGIWR